MAAAVAGAMLLYKPSHRKIVFALPPAALGLTFVIALVPLFAVALLQMGLGIWTPPRRRFSPLLEPLFGSLCGILWLGRRYGGQNRRKRFDPGGCDAAGHPARFPAKKGRKCFRGLDRPEGQE